MRRLDSSSCVAGYFRLFLRLAVVGCLSVVFLCGVSEAKTKRLKKDFMKSAGKIAKDREAAFAGGEAMKMEEFKKIWADFSERLDAEYKGHEIKLKTFGTDVSYRKAFTHALYMALRVHNRVSPLVPAPQELIANHSFLQELVLEGSCYTGGDAFPKKMRDLLKASPEIQFSVREHLGKWGDKYREKFEKLFGKG